jgi:hypothetical protein
MTAAAGHWWWVIPLASFLGGGVVAWGLGLFFTYLIAQPVISVCLDKSKGSTGITPLLVKLEEKGEWTFSHNVRYLRLRIENTGLSSVRDCCGLITGLKKHTADKGQVVPPQEVFHLGWAHHTESRMRDIPRGRLLLHGYRHIRPTLADATSSAVCRLSNIAVSVL